MSERAEALRELGKRISDWSEIADACPQEVLDRLRLPFVQQLCDAQSALERVIGFYVRRQPETPADFFNALADFEEHLEAARDMIREGMIDGVRH